ncbi:MAG: 30S ribosomal protein S12 methylthiotransferase RimO [Pseudomonadota bacterium]
MSEHKTSARRAARIGFVSLGCPKNTVDSERILTQLRTEGYQISPDYQGAEVVIVNTCGFIDAAKKESLDTIGEALQENGKVIVTGCMGATENDIREVHPGVLSVSGPQQYEAVLDSVHNHAPPPAREHDPFTDLVPPQGIKLTPRHYAYLKISEGCDHTCSFCIIPSMRGKLVSRPIGEVLDEARRLADAGVKELLVISQDTSAYGSDLGYKLDFWNGRPIKTRLYDLCQALGEMGIWVRLHYIYPYPHVDDIIPLMAEGKLLPYLDIPFQHASRRVLRKMRRPAATENTLKRIEKWREICPDITLRSTFIVGFPGETEDDFEELLAFLERAQLDRVGCFKYSAVEGAAANELHDPVDEETKELRYQRFMQLQQKISTEKLAQKVGQRCRILIDEVVDEGAVGRSQADAPDIDGLVFIDGATHLEPGQYVEAEIEETDEYDMWAHLI